MQILFDKSTTAALIAGLLLSVLFFGDSADALDSERYIGIDEVKPGMQAHCLTVYKGKEIEKFDLDVLSVVHNYRPGRDAILVKGTDERFIKTGPVGGCSGSPVFIEGRLAGALAFGFLFSKEALYGVTPIKDMLEAGKVKSQDGSKIDFDFTDPIDFSQINKKLRDSTFWKLDGGPAGSSSGFAPLLLPMVTSGLPNELVRDLDDFVRPLGFMAVAGGGSSSLYPAESSESRTHSDRSIELKMEPGGALAVPLLTGDMTISVVGTVTEVIEDRIYGFGHSFLGYGQIDLPLATGKVHTVVSSLYRSFKFSTADKIVGALRADESAAVYGKMNERAGMIPLRINVHRYNASEAEVYHCRMADNRILTPLIVSYAARGAALARGSLPPEHKVQYRVCIEVGDTGTLAFENLSTGHGLKELLMELQGSVALIMNNPYKQVDISAVEFDIDIARDNVSSHIWSAELSDTKVKPGQEIEVQAVVETFLGSKKRYKRSVKIPETLKPGKYNILLCGGDGYLQFLRKAAPYRFIPENFSGLMDALNNILQIKRDRMYVVLMLPASGLAIEKAELPDLPATKALVLQNAKRSLQSSPYQQWIQKSIKTETVIRDKKIMHITVEK